jgi:hypothetical protein
MVRVRMPGQSDDMTTPQNHPHDPAERDISNRGPAFLSLHTTVVLLAAIVIGSSVGVLTAAAGIGSAKCILVGLTAGGSSIPGLRSLIQ